MRQGKDTKREIRRERVGGEENESRTICFSEESRRKRRKKTKKKENLKRGGLDFFLAYFCFLTNKNRIWSICCVFKD